MDVASDQEGLHAGMMLRMHAHASLPLAQQLRMQYTGDIATSAVLLLC